VDHRAPRTLTRPSLNLYLIRHAHAVTADENPERPLSVRGRGEVVRLAAFFRTNGLLRPAQLWHSPLSRARETALLLNSALALDAVLVETPGLLPEDDPEEIVQRLAAYPVDHSLALAGHEPYLSALATLLVRDKRKPVAFHLRKGAVIALQREDAVHKRSGLPRWRIRWHFSPELLPPAIPILAAVPATIEGAKP
jgi:phosphohistidine phosphatase